MKAIYGFQNLPDLIFLGFAVLVPLNIDAGVSRPRHPEDRMTASALAGKAEIGLAKTSQVFVSDIDASVSNHLKNFCVLVHDEMVSLLISMVNEYDESCRSFVW